MAMMRKSSLFLIAIPVLLVNNYTGELRCVHAQGVNNNNTTTTTSGNVVCIDLADFHYEIILGLSTFPSQAACTDQEEAEISSFLQDTLNSELAALPGTIKTQNKVCSNPINTRRRLRRLLPTRLSISRFFSLDKNQYIRHRRRLLRAFIYTGGGRCRYCFTDDQDQRALSSPQRKLSTSFRNLLFLYSIQNADTPPLSDAADISLCKNTTLSVLVLDKFLQKTIYKDYVQWINDKELTSFEYKDGFRPWNADLYNPRFGLYHAGDTFGVQINSMEGVLRQYMKQLEEKHEKHELRKEPLKEGRFIFRLFTFDLSPEDSAAGIFAEDPLYLFINGIKLDFSLLIAQQQEKESSENDDTESGAKELSGSSFAGIRWSIKLELEADFAYRSQPDRRYEISITAPYLVFAHKNQLDVDFIFKPNANQAYAIGRMRFDFLSAQCKVTGLENSRFQDFQSAVESKLFHKMGMALAHEFQGQQGHCLYDKIPVVDVHLVEKESWKESNPQCG